MPAETSVESVLSDDYAIPPDAVSTDTLSLDSVDPFPPPRPVRLSEITSPRKSLEKSGYLTKLGGKLKTWKRRWFVLKNGALRYYKSQGDTARKPRGQITLDDVCRVTRSEGAATFEVNCDGKRSFYLSAESTSTMEEWVKVLQCVLRRNATRLLLSKEDHKPAIDGWLTKVKHGHSRRCWCSLIGRTFLYFKTPNDMTPLGQISMREVRVEEVVHVSDSDEEGSSREGPVGRSEYTVGIFPPHQSPTYLLMASKQELDTWLYHLTVVSSGDSVVGTQYEQLMSKLMEVDGDESEWLYVDWGCLYFRKSRRACKNIFKTRTHNLNCCGIFFGLAKLEPSLVEECLNERLTAVSRRSSQQLLLCATQSLFLCDTASSSSGDKGSPTSQLAPSPEKGGSPKGPAEGKQNPPPFVLIQGWQLLALAVSLFPPRNRTLWYLRAHLHRNADTKTEPGKYAVFCQRALERALGAGERECKPSRMEVLSILLKNPFHHSNPHSIPVHFLNSTYLVGIQGSAARGLGRPMTLSYRYIGKGSIHKYFFGFFLHSSVSNLTELKRMAPLVVQLCDVISRWEQALREKHLGKFENTRVIKLTYKNRRLLKAETDKERLLTAYHLNEDLVQGRFPLSQELSLELAALMAQIEFGDYNGERARGSGSTPKLNPPQQLQLVVERFFPKQYREPGRDKCTMEAIRERWSALKGKPVFDCVRIYLNCVRKWSFCGARLFSARWRRPPLQIKAKEQQTIWLAVTEDGISLLDCSCMQPWARYPYSSVMTFGGCRDDFMLVVCPDDSESLTERLLFVMPKPKILELTLLIADYMNALG
uniref:PlekhH1, putative n=1 Tax=Ixodes scapularis TaxID=6945 RepID=A0A1S4KKL1_IXOSC